MLCAFRKMAFADTLSFNTSSKTCHSAFAVSEAQKDAFDLLSIMEAFTVRSEL